MKKALIFCLLLAGCSERYVIYTKSEIRQYWLTRIDKSKRPLVFLVDAETGNRYDSIELKRCKNVNELEVGRLYEIKRNYWADQGREFSDFDKHSIDSVFRTKKESRNNLTE